MSAIAIVNHASSSSSYSESPSPPASQRQTAGTNMTDRTYVDQAGAGNSSDEQTITLTINTQKQLFPFCLVWGPLPLITWIFPFIGHMGIGDSEGHVHDFAGPYYIGTDSFMVGDVCKYYQFDPKDYPQLASRPQRVWDNAIRNADADYRQMMHNLCCNNCHHHASHALKYMGFPSTMLSAWFKITFQGRYTSWGAILKTYIPFIIFLAIIAIFLLA